MTAVLVSTLIIVPALGIGNTNELFNWLLKLNCSSNADEILMGILSLYGT